MTTRSEDTGREIGICRLSVLDAGPRSVEAYMYKKNVATINVSSACLAGMERGFFLFLCFRKQINIELL